AEKNPDGSLKDEAALKAQQDEANALKEAAKEAIAKVTDDAQKAELDKQADAINNDFPTADPVKAADEALAKAKAAEAALDEAIANAEKNPDGSLKDEAALKAQQDEANALKEAAKEAIAKVTDDAQKAELDKQADAINNDFPTADPVKAADEALAKAKAAEAALDEAIANAEKNLDGSLKDESDVDLLVAQNNANAFKDFAKGLIERLPDSMKKTELAEQVESINNDFPVGDPLKAAEYILAEAKEAEAALDEAIANAEKNPDGSLKDEAALKAQQDEANALKEAAKEAIAKVTDDAQKAELDKQADAINNDFPTADPVKAADEALAKAKAAEAALDEAIANAEKNPDGSLKDEAALKAQQDEANALKEAAKEAIAKVTDDAQKAELDKQADEINNDFPEVEEPYPLPDQTDTSAWEDDGEDSDDPRDADPRDDSEVDDTPQLEPNVIITGRPIPSAKPSKSVVDKIKAKNPNSVDQINDQAQIDGNEAANLVVVGRGTDSTNIAGRQSITAGSIKTNGGDDTVVITNNVIRSTIDTGADNDKLDIRGNSRSSILSMGTGDDVLTIRGKLAGVNNQVNLGDGDDTMIVAGGAVFNGSAASSHATKTNWNKIDLGAGNDKLSIGEKGAGNIQYTDIQAGSGDDVITLSPNRGKGDLFWVNVDLGDGNDELIVKASDLRMTYINGGEGNDTIDLSQAQFTTTYHTHVGDTRIDGGNGNDKIILGDVGYTTDAHYYKITGGAGDDIVEFTQDYSIHEYNTGGAEINTNRNQVDIQGGEGFDTVSITGSGTTVDMSSGTSGSNRPEGLRDFEAVDMTASGSQTVKVKLADVLANSGTLYVAGDSSDTVDLGSDGNGSLGGFSKTTETTTRTALDGSEHTYTAYTNGNAKVYIDDTITNII
ncbi:hypothetical protein NSA18_04660, partial [Pasteurella caecimuris]|nr:hypothetical protein [Pasteurella caecimuris]